MQRLYATQITMTPTALSDLKLCVDRLLPGQEFSELYQPGAQATSRAAIMFEKRWEVGRTLRIRFLDGPDAVQRKVAQFAQEWCAYANIQLAFDNDADAEIRISFLQPGSWSQIGKDALDRRNGNAEPTMNFGWLTPATPNDEVRRVVLHEFGHALGLVHEHQSPAVAIPWNKDAVYAYYQGPPNLWTREQVDINIFQLYNKQITKYSRFDRKSIMLYPIPAEMTTGGFAVGWNSELSHLDKLYVRKWYPAAKKAKK